MDYDYQRFEQILTLLLESSWIDHDDEQEIGENVSDQPEVKIMFDGYGDLETEDENGEYHYEEGGNKNMQSYAIFIHKDALTEGFEFPEHDTYAFTFGSMIAHRPSDEVCLFAWYDVENECWDFIPLEDRIDSDCAMNEKDIMEILEGLYNRYFKE